MSTMIVDRPVTSAPLETERTRCSEAMRRGARYHEQARGAFYDPVGDTTCALGALVVGLLGAEPVERGTWCAGHLRQVVVQHTGVDLGCTVFCPATKQREHLDVAMMVLNDRAGWSREQIADWLESLGL